MTAGPDINACGLASSELALLRQTLAATPGLTRARLFGSRAKGTFRPSSDIDLAVEGLANELEVEALRDRLNELPLPYAVDAQDLETIKNPDLRAHIAGVGAVVFDRAADSTQG